MSAQQKKILNIAKHEMDVLSNELSSKINKNAELAKKNLNTKDGIVKDILRQILYDSRQRKAYNILQFSFESVKDHFSEILEAKIDVPEYLRKDVSNILSIHDCLFKDKYYEEAYNLITSQLTPGQLKLCCTPDISITNHVNFHFTNEDLCKVLNTLVDTSSTIINKDALRLLEDTSLVNSSSSLSSSQGLNTNISPVIPAPVSQSLQTNTNVSMNTPFNPNVLNTNTVSMYTTLSGTTTNQLNTQIMPTPSLFKDCLPSNNFNNMNNNCIQGNMNAMGGYSQQFNSMQNNSMQGNSQQFNPMQGNSMQGNSMQGNSMQGNSMQGNSMQGNSMQGNSMQGNNMQGNSMQGNNMQFNPMQGNSQQFNPMQNNIQGNSQQFNPMQNNIQGNSQQFNPMQNNMQGNPMQNNIQGNPMQNNSMQNNSMQNNSMQFNPMQINPMQGYSQQNFPQSMIMQQQPPTSQSFMKEPF